MKSENILKKAKINDFPYFESISMLDSILKKLVRIQPRVYFFNPTCTRAIYNYFVLICLSNLMSFMKKLIVRCHAIYY